MAKEKFRSGQELDDEDSAASRAVGIRQGQIIQTHDAIQTALDRMEETQATGSEIEQAIFPDPRPGKGNFDPQQFLAEGEIAEAVAAHQGPDRPEAGAGRRRAGFSAILPDIAEEAIEAAAPVAGGVAAGSGAAAGAAAAGGAGLAAAGGVGVVAALAAEQAIKAIGQQETPITAPGGGRTITQRGDEQLDALLEVQQKVAKVGLPDFGGVKTSAPGSKL